tara:strand:+ start:425 stop:811 length:387 start_codon:yes stop_codon:yes gene_type:complete
MSEVDCGTCPSTSVITEIPAVTVQASLTISEKAHSMLTQAIGDSEVSLLVNVLNGGCSGFTYDLQLVEETDLDCQALEVSGISVLVPQTASNMLDGVEIDYVDKLMGGGFKVNNPNAEKTCGCGESFR